MAELFCPRCKVVLALRQDQAGNKFYVCPQCGSRVAQGQPAETQRITARSKPRSAASAGRSQGVSRSAPQTGKLVGGPGPDKPIQVVPVKAVTPESFLSRRPWLIPAVGAGIASVAAGVLLVIWLSRDSSPEPQAQGQKQVDYLAELKSPDPQVRVHGVRTMSDLGRDARPLLYYFLEALKDPDPEVQRLARESLKRRGPAEATDLPVLSLALQDPEPQVRLFAVRAVAVFGPEASAELALVRGLTADDDQQVNKAANEVLDQLSKKELTSLTRKLELGSPRERAEAAQGLAALGPNASTALPALLSALMDDNPSVRLAAKDALVQIGPAAVRHLGEALSDSRQQVRKSAAEVLGRMGADARDLLPHLVAAAEEPGLRNTAVVALAQIGGEAIPDIVKTLSSTTSATGKEILAEALAKIGPDVLAALNSVRDPAPEIRDVTSSLRDRIKDMPPEPEEELTGQTALIYDELLAQFKVWDADNDGNLDKQELATAFRIPASEASKSPMPQQMQQRPDLMFLARVDTNSDDKISTPEYNRWARDYAKAMNRALEAQAEVNRTYLALNQLAAAMAAAQASADLAQRTALLQQQSALVSSLSRLRALEQSAFAVWVRWAGPTVNYVVIRRVHNNLTTNITNNHTTNVTVNRHTVAGTRPPHPGVTHAPASVRPPGVTHPPVVHRPPVVYRPPVITRPPAVRPPVPVPRPAIRATR